MATGKPKMSFFDAQSEIKRASPSLDRDEKLSRCPDR